MKAVFIGEYVKYKSKLQLKKDAILRTLVCYVQWRLFNDTYYINKYIKLDWDILERRNFSVT